MIDAGLKKAIKKPRSEVFRRVFIKRRDVDTGLYESTWLDVTSDVKKFGKIHSSIDSARLNRFNFANAKIVFHNDSGRYNPSSEQDSLWSGYLNQQRTLVKIEAGFRAEVAHPDGYTASLETPGGLSWDEAIWDHVDSYWDPEDDPTLFVGLISGDIFLSDSNEVSFNLKPLTSVFQDFPAKRLLNWEPAGYTASDFIAKIRDATDGAGSFVFRPFFGDTTSNWDISSTSIVYANLNTSASIHVQNATLWDVMSNLAEAENYIMMISKAGQFRFVSRDGNTTTCAYDFHGAGIPSGDYGTTIKTVSAYGPRHTKYYSRVRVKFGEENTTTSFSVQEAAFTVGPNSNPWILGDRTLEVTNPFISTTATADSVSLALFTEYSSLKNEITFRTSFVPHLELLDRVCMFYDPAPLGTGNNRWDQFNWGTDTTTAISTDLIFDGFRGNAIYLNGEEFKFLSIEIDLDSLECNFVAREV